MTIVSSLRFSRSSDTSIGDFRKFGIHSFLSHSSSNFHSWEITMYYLNSIDTWLFGRSELGLSLGCFKTSRTHSGGSMCSDTCRPHSSYLSSPPPPLAGKRSLRLLLLPPRSRGCLTWGSGSCICWYHWRHFHFWWPRFHGSVRPGRTRRLPRPGSS